MRLENRVAIVTGGARGIGRAICLNLSQEGAKVVIPDINLDGAQETARMIKDDGGEALATETDVTKKSEVQAMVTEAIETYRKIDILVNNAGVDIKNRVVDFEEADWDKIMNLNLKGVFLCTQAVLPSMMKRKYGRIVNISSMAGKTGEAYTAPYCTSKWGVIGFTQSVALEVGKYQITVNAVCPGCVETELIHQSLGKAAEILGMSTSEVMQRFCIDLTPLGRMATPLDVARGVTFLASDEAEFITGSSLNVTGGREMH